jgi:hypothetical protein
MQQGIPNLLYPPSQKTTGLPVDERKKYSPIGVEDRRCAMARFRPEDAADNRVVAEGEDG